MKKGLIQQMRQGCAGPFDIMDSPGKHLKTERELRNLSLEEVSKSTRIKEQFLRAIEEDRYDLCPSPFYVKGFLTSYGRFLGIDTRPVLLQYEKLIQPSPPADVIPQKLSRETIRSEKGIQTRALFRLLLASALFISLLIPLYFYLSNPPLQVPDLPALSQRKPIPPDVATAEGHHAVIQQINQLELIGPKEVQAEPFYQVSEAHFGTGIEMESGRPMVVGKGSEFRCENQRVYFFTRIVTSQEGRISHVWRWEGEEFHRIEMVVKPPSWSVYSYITLHLTRSGNWKVEVWDGDKKLTDLSFKACKS